MLGPMVSILGDPPPQVGNGDAVGHCRLACGACKPCAKSDLEVGVITKMVPGGPIMSCDRDGDENG